MEMMPDFKDIKYTRPDIDAITASIKDLRLRLMTAQDINQASDILMEYEKLIIEFNTEYELCNVLHDLDTSDEFYSDELEFFDEAAASLSELSAAMLTVMVNCPCADALKLKYGDMIFRKALNLKETISPDVIDDYAEESSLQNDYAQIQSEASIRFDGKDLNLSMLAPFLESTRRQVRKDAHKALDEYYMGKKETFDKIYDDMVRVRTRIAKKLGYTGIAICEPLIWFVCAIYILIAFKLSLKKQNDRFGKDDVPYEERDELFDYDG